MILPDPSDAIHKAWLYRILSGIADDEFLISQLRFKGGTCAAMRHIIDRFSVDLDFDLLDQAKVEDVRRHLEKIFLKLELKIDEQSKRVPQYFLKYKNKAGERNTMRLDVTFPPPKSNDYEALRLNEIDRVIYCHTVPTMFANKLVSVIDRYEKHGSIAGRDVYDIHTFFLKGFKYKPGIIMERRQKSAVDFLMELQKFIEKYFTQTVIDQDLSVLLPPADFKRARKILKQEVLMFLTDEINNINL
jgi:predicted nucleotidyltransferase component of viral defense system